MDSKQLKLGKSKTVFEETCYICGQELQNPSFYEDAHMSSYALCSKHNNWKFKALIEFLTPILILTIPFIVFLSLFGLDDKVVERLHCMLRKLEEEADTRDD